MGIGLGDPVRDVITGFQGVVIGYVRYISGCNQCLVVPKVDKEGKRREGEWFDEQRLVRMKGPTVVLDNGSGAGFDREPPQR